MPYIRRDIEKMNKRYDDMMRRLNDPRLRGDQLRQRLFYEKIELVWRMLDTPRIVCSDFACLEYWEDSDGLKQVRYTSICPEGHDILNSPIQTTACAEFLKCAVFGGKENCKICGHHWKVHLCVMVELERRMVRIIDKMVEEMLKKNASDIVLKETAIQDLKSGIAKVDYEYKEIQDAAARLCVFLKRNSILPYNEAMIAYVDHLIKDETEMVNLGGDRCRLEDTIRYRLENIQLVEVLKKNMENCIQIELLDEVGVENLVEHLCQMKFCGYDLRQIKDMAAPIRMATYRERLYRIQGRNSSCSWSLGNSSDSNS